MLLTRSPLYNHPEVGYSFDLHVLSTPPAFILSQDQTLRSKSAPKDASSKNLNLGLLSRCPEPCSGGGHLTRFITSLFVSQYPVFKVLGGPSGPSRASAGGKRARRYITAPRYRCQELFSEILTLFLSVLISLKRSALSETLGRSHAKSAG